MVSQRRTRHGNECCTRTGRAAHSRLRDAVSSCAGRRGAVSLVGGIHCVVWELFEYGREWSSEEKERKSCLSSSSSRCDDPASFSQLPSCTQQKNKGDGSSAAVFRRADDDRLTTTAAYTEARGASGGDAATRRGGESGTPGFAFFLTRRLGRRQKSVQATTSEPYEGEKGEKRNCEGPATAKRWLSGRPLASPATLRAHTARERRNTLVYPPSEHPRRPLRLPSTLGRPNPPCHPVRDPVEGSLVRRAVHVGLKKNVRAEESGGGRLGAVEVN